MDNSIVLIGKPNVGKSTLLNSLANKPLASVSSKPQTTVYLLRGLAEICGRKILCIDTPGIHRVIHQSRNKNMNKLSYATMHGHDLVLCLFKAGSWDIDDANIQNCLASVVVPKIAVITQIDKANEAQLEMTISKLNKELFTGIIAISAAKNKHIDILKASIMCAIPESKNIQGSLEHSDAFLLQEMLREQIMQQLHQELPYVLQIEPVKCERTPQKLVAHANIIANKFSQKKIIIGQHGQRIKSIGMLARKRLSHLLGIGVELRLWVQCKEQAQVKDYVE